MLALYIVCMVLTSLATTQAAELPILPKHKVLPRFVQLRRQSSEPSTHPTQQQQIRRSRSVTPSSIFSTPFNNIQERVVEIITKLIPPIDFNTEEPVKKPTKLKKSPASDNLHALAPGTPVTPDPQASCTPATPASQVINNVHAKASSTPTTPGPLEALLFPGQKGSPKIEARIFSPYNATETMPFGSCRS